MSRKDTLGKDGKGCAGVPVPGPFLVLSEPTLGPSHLGTGSRPAEEGGLLPVLLHGEGCLLTEGEPWGPNAGIAAVLPKSDVERTREARGPRGHAGGTQS